jgi:hypothetical protein
MEPAGLRMNEGGGERPRSPFELGEAPVLQDLLRGGTRRELFRTSTRVEAARCFSVFLNEGRFILSNRISQLAGELMLNSTPASS